ncbi:hypothetical protein WEI85_07245 [Actinomycetes bacterium KLBMP 9797]
MRNAADLALLGILTTVGSLGVVTAGAAVATASAAVHDWHGGDAAWPSLRVTLRRYLRGLLPGILPALIAVVGAALLTVNLSAITRGVVPGGAPLAVATIALMAAAAGYAGIAVVEVGRQGGTGWRAAAGSAYRIAQRRPAAVLAGAGVIALVVALGLMIIPVLTPVLTGYAILALHAVTRRLAPSS